MKRAYGSEPVLLTSSPVTKTPATSLAAKHRINRRLIQVSGLGILVLVVIATTWWLMRPADSIPASIRNSVDYSLYQPSWLPSRAHIQKGTFRATAGIVTFFISYGGNKQLAVTEQAMPAQFDFDQFYLTQIDGEKSVQTPIGKAVIGTFNGNALASITSDQTWIMLSAPDGIAATDLEHIVKSLH